MARLGRMLGLGRNASYDAGTRLFDQGLYEAAIAELAKARGADTKRRDQMTDRLAAFYTAESYAHLGHTALSQGGWERAQECFLRALEIHPHYADLHFNLALAQRACQQPDAALGSLQNALCINPHFAKAHYYRGLILYAMGEHEAGIRSLCSAIEREPGFRTPAFANGLNRHLEGDFEAALQAFEQVSQSDVDDIQFHFHRADDLYRRGLITEAIAEYENALAINPNYADIRNHLGLAYSVQGMVAEAIAEFERALAINPRFVDAMINLATLLRDNGRISEARSLFARVLETEPNDPVTQDRVAQAASQTEEQETGSERKEKRLRRVA